MILTPLQKLPKNVEDLSKLIVVNGLKNLPKVKKIAQSGHTDGDGGSSSITIWPRISFGISYSFASKEKMQIKYPFLHNPLLQHWHCAEGASGYPSRVKGRGNSNFSPIQYSAPILACLLARDRTLCCVDDGEAWLTAKICRWNEG